MSKAFKSISAVLMIAILVSISLSAIAFAASEKSIDIAESKGCYVTVSNVIEEKTVGSYPLYIANAPVTVKYHGDNLSSETVEYYPDAKLQNGSLDMGEKYEEVKFTVKKYYYYGDEAKVYDELLQEPDMIPVYVTGNYAILSKPGYYYVSGAPEAIAGTGFILQVTGNSTAPGKAVSAVPTASKVLVNGKSISFDAYNINGNNYFKLRDLAMAVNGTEKQFEVSWDGSRNAISLEAGKAYTSAGGELAVSANRTAKDAKTTTAKIFVDGKEVSFIAYNIGGNNYFKLRDIAKAINFAVTWDANASTIGIDTANNYTE